MITGHQAEEEGEGRLCTYLKVVVSGAQKRTGRRGEELVYEGVAFLSALTVVAVLRLLPRRCDTHLVSRLHCILYLTDIGTWPGIRVTSQPGV